MALQQEGKVHAQVREVTSPRLIGINVRSGIFCWVLRTIATFHMPAKMYVNVVDLCYIYSAIEP